MTNNTDSEQLLSAWTQLQKLMLQKASYSREDKVATMLQFSALSFLKEKPHVTNNELAEQLHLSKSSATQLIERLVKNNFVQRKTDPEDRRSVHLAITDLGQMERENIKKKILDKVGHVLSLIPVEDRKHLIRIYSNLVEILKNK